MRRSPTRPRVASGRKAVWLVPLCLLTPPLRAAAAEDVAHRADRIRTEELNRAVRSAVARRDDRNDEALSRYEAARARYDRDLADWRRRVAKCEAGDHAACER